MEKKLGRFTVVESTAFACDICGDDCILFLGRTKVNGDREVALVACQEHAQELNVMLGVAIASAAVQRFADDITVSWTCPKCHCATFTSCASAGVDQVMCAQCAVISPSVP